MEEFDAEREAKITSDVIKMIHPIYPQFDSDMIAAGIKQVLENDKDHKLRTYEIDILQNKPMKKKQRRSISISSFLFLYFIFCVN